MKIGIVGSGYVGLVSGACFAEMGNNVICIDNNIEKIENLKKGIVPIYDPGLEEIITKNVGIGNLSFTHDLESAIKNVQIVFIAVGTPMGSDGTADLQYVLNVATGIGKNMSKRLIVVDKSTVPVGTARRVKKIIQNELDARQINLEFDIVSNPEFLKEGKAIQDFMQPDRIVVGAESDYAFEKMREIYSSFFKQNNRIIEMDIESAEMTKYAANAMLATKISFINEMANICEKVGADINKVREGIGSDSRIGHSFIYPGCGYGGSCFPKDLLALRKLAQEVGYEAKLITSVDEVNTNQKLVIAQKVLKKFGNDLAGLTFAIWGLAFKPDTDDMREAPSINIIKTLISHGAKIKAYDPKAMTEAKSHYLKDMDVDYVKDKYEALKEADALILITEWREFRSPDFELIATLLKNKLIFDGRNQYDKNTLKSMSFEYIQIGV